MSGTNSIQPGKLLAGKYVVLSCVGEGGMGRVYSARHQALGHMVAVKTTRHDVLTEELVTRFLDEGKASARIQSEHVARVIDVGLEEPTRTPYMVMEYLEGATLAEVLEARRALPCEEAVTWVLQACEGVAEAHALGIVHRDLKPENLFLTRRRIGPPVLKVLDFGVAKLVGERDERGVAGTPQYMAPEQVCGTAQGPGTDIWALGVVLFELLTGTVPFDGDTVDKVAGAIMFDAVPSVKSRAPGAPDGIQAVIARCLAKSAADRFPTVGDLAAALAEFAPEAARTSLPRIPLANAPRKTGDALAHTLRVEVPRSVKPARPSWLPWTLAAAVVVLALGAREMVGVNAPSQASSSWRTATRAAARARVIPAPLPAGPAVAKRLQ